MPPRFMERMARQSETLKTVFGEPQDDPPPYPSSRSSRAGSEASSQYGQFKSAPPRYSQMRRQSSSEHTAIPDNALVLVSGANSWQGMHIVDQLLQRGYRVRGAVRNVDKAAFTSKHFQDKYGANRFSTVIVPDMAAKSAFHLAVRGCAGVVHVASVTNMSPDPNEVITPSIAGAINAAEAAAQESSVLRFVYCSDVAAAVSHDRGVKNEVTSESWNMLDFEDAWEPPPYEQTRAMAVYASSKMQTEAALWRWYVRQRPGFVLNTVLPDTLFGATLDPKHAQPKSSKLLKSLQQGQKDFSFAPSHAVDVEDSALLHVAALTLPDVKGQRLFAASALCNVQTLVRLLQELIPGGEIATDAPNVGIDMTDFKEIARAEDLLRRMGRNGWTELKTSVERALQEFQ